MADGPGPSRPQLLTSAEVLQEIKREMAIFEATGDRPLCLQRIYAAVCTLPPTSVEAERVFSAAGLFITKIRARLNDEAIDSLCFLHHFFSQSKEILVHHFCCLMKNILSLMPSLSFVWSLSIMWLLGKRSFFAIFFF